MTTDPPKIDKPALNEKGEPQIEFVLVQDLGLAEPHPLILTKLPEGFLEFVLSKVRADPGKRHPVYIRIKGYTKEEIAPLLGFMAEMIFFDGPLIYRATYPFMEQSMEDLAELFLANLESKELEGGSGKVFI